MQRLTGLLMGDGDIHGRADANPHFRIRMTTRPYLAHLREYYGSLGTDVFLERTATYQARQARETGHERFQTVNEEEYSDLYGFRTRSHPELHRLADWYDGGVKRFPSDLELTPIVARAWFVCDGWLAREDDRSRAMIKARNERDRAEFLCSLFEQHGFSPTFSRDSIQFGRADTERFFEWLGEPPPGFAYKWPGQS